MTRQEAAARRRIVAVLQSANARAHARGSARAEDANLYAAAAAATAAIELVAGSKSFFGRHKYKLCVAAASAIGQRRGQHACALLLGLRARERRAASGKRRGRDRRGRCGKRARSCLNIR